MHGTITHVGLTISLPAIQPLRSRDSSLSMAL